MRDSGCVKCDVGHTPYDPLRSVERSGVRQLHDSDEILLILRRNEATGDDSKHEPRGGEQCRIDAQHHGSAADERPYSSAVSGRPARKDTIKPAEEPAKHAVDAPLKAVWISIGGLEQQRG